MLSALSKKQFFKILIPAMIICAGAQAQKTTKILLRPKVNKVTVSLYNKIKVVDARPDTTNYGIVQKGMMDENAKVILKQPLQIQLNNILADLVDEKSGQGEILIQLRQVTFAEITKVFSQKGYFYMKAIIYGKDAEGYKRLGKIDTLVTVSAGDVTGKLLRTGAETISNFIAANLNKAPSASANFSYNDIAKVEDSEKSNVKLYTTTTYIEGLYKSFKSFADQTPDGTFIVDGKTVKKSTVKIFDVKGAKVKPKLDSIYAIVYQGKPYIATSYDFYPLEKTNSDFYFTGKVPPGSNTSEIMNGYALMGVAGALLAAGSNVAPTFDVKIYHLNGDFIRLKEIKTDFGD
jgi:archaellum component FlaG (FlaF/FlaG flagellin family)